MTKAKLEQYRRRLVEMRERVGGEVNRVVEALKEEVHINTNLSAAPVHLADVASVAVDADIEVLHTERSILDQINDALSRIDGGAFGVCRDCGGVISEERLTALPYTALCVSCARTTARQTATTTT